MRQAQGIKIQSREVYKVKELDLDVLGHDGHALGMDGAKVGVLEQANEVRLRSFLKGLQAATQKQHT